MGYGVWKRFVRRLSGSVDNDGGEPQAAAPTLGDVQTVLTEEFRGVRKMLRKQGAAVQELLNRGEAPPAPAATASGGDLLQLAVAFFHLDQSLHDLLADSPAHREAVALFWLQLEHGLNEIGVQMIREQGIPFDARLHRAVLSRGTGTGAWTVAEVLEPGFLQQGAVRTPAKVVLVPTKAEQDQQEEHQ